MPSGSTSSCGTASPSRTCATSKVRPEGRRDVSRCAHPGDVGSRIGVWPRNEVDPGNQKSHADRRGSSILFCLAVRIRDPTRRRPSVDQSLPKSPSSERFRRFIKQTCSRPRTARVQPLRSVEPRWILRFTALLLGFLRVIYLEVHGSYSSVRGPTIEAIYTYPPTRENIHRPLAGDGARAPRNANRSQ